MTIEIRSLVEPVEFRSQGTKLTASGVAMRYGAKSKPIAGKFREVFQPGAFAKTLNDDKTAKTLDIRSHLEHHGPYLGRTGNGSLRLTDTRSELAYELDLPDTSAGRDAANLLERQDIRGSSIGFNAVRSTEKWTVDDDGLTLRSIGEARLGLIDLTIAPYYDSSTAEIALRSLADERGIEVRSLLEAAERGELPTIVSAPETGEERSEEDTQDEGRENPTFARERISWLI